MRSLFRKLTEPSYAVMRIAFGVLFAFHGAQKLFGAFGGSQANSALMWVAGNRRVRWWPGDCGGSLHQLCGTAGLRPDVCRLPLEAPAEFVVSDSEPWRARFTLCFCLPLHPLQRSRHLVRGQEKFVAAKPLQEGGSGAPGPPSSTVIL